MECFAYEGGIPAYRDKFVDISRIVSPLEGKKVTMAKNTYKCSWTGGLSTSLILGRNRQ